MPNFVYKAGASAPHYGHDVFTVGLHTDGEPGKLGNFIPHGSQLLDTGPGRTYASKDFADGQGRRLLWGWGPGSVLTLPREILWDPELQQLVFAPIPETELLRVPIGPHVDVKLALYNRSAVVQTLANNAMLVNGTAEVLLNITRPSVAATFGIAVSTNLSGSGSISTALGLYIYIAYVPPTAPGPHSAGLGIVDLGDSKSHNNIHESFAVSDHDRFLSLRIYKDQDLLEVFWQGGRVVKALRGGGGDIVAMLTSGEVEGEASVWGMASNVVSAAEVLRTPRLVNFDAT
jgi:sucrose-6-phosphate hydrolase SacC (GH32 family)